MFVGSARLFMLFVKRIMGYIAHLYELDILKGGGHSFTVMYDKMAYRTCKWCINIHVKMMHYEQNTSRFATFQHSMTWRHLLKFCFRRHL